MEGEDGAAGGVRDGDEWRQREPSHAALIGWFKQPSACRSDRRSDLPLLPHHDMDDDPHSQIDLLKRKLTEERDDRVKTEGEACKMLRGIRKKYDTLLRERDQEVDELRSSLAAEQDRNQQVVQELKNQLVRSRQETNKLEKSSPRTPTPRTPVPPSPSKSTPKPNNADFIDSLGKEIADLKSHIGDYKAQLEAKQRDLNSAVLKQEVTKNINIGLREDNRKLADEIARLKSSLKTAQLDADVKAAETISRLERERNDLKRQVSKYEQEEARVKRREGHWNSSMEDKEKLIKAQNSEIKELKEKCEKYRQEKALETERERAVLLSELRDLRKDLDKKSKDLNAQTSTAHQLKLICEEVGNQADEFDNLLKKKTEEYNNVLRDKQSLEQEKQRLKQEIASLKQSLSLEKETQEKSVTDLRNRIKHLEENLAAETGRVRSLKLEVREERSRTEAECRRVADLQEQLQQCVDEADNADNRSEQLESEIREIKEEAARHISEVFSLQANVNSLKSSLARAHFTIQTLEERIESLLAQMEKEKQDSETEIFRLSERLRQHHELENQMMTKIEKLEKTKKVSKK